MGKHSEDQDVLIKADRTATIVVLVATLVFAATVIGVVMLF